MNYKMASTHEENTIKNVSQLKQQLQNIIKNIRQLEELQANTQQLNQTELRGITEQTDSLLFQVETTPIDKFLKHIQKRKNNRKINKIKRKSKRRQKTQDLKEEQKISTDPIAVALVPSKCQPTLTRTPPTKQKLHHQFRNCHDAQRFLRTFELLKILHLARSQDAEETRRFATQFNNLSTIWNSILLENRPQRTQEHKIEDQWNAVLFGASDKTYYTKERKMSDFVEIRRTWDSYLTRSSKHGSSIPIGWVLPNEAADERWQKYISK